MNWNSLRSLLSKRIYYKDSIIQLVLLLAVIEAVAIVTLGAKVVVESMAAVTETAAVPGVSVDLVGVEDLSVATDLSLKAPVVIGIDLIGAPDKALEDLHDVATQEMILDLLAGQ